LGCFFALDFPAKGSVDGRVHVDGPPPARAPANPLTWQRIVRRAEALYALIAQRHGSETGVAGIQWAVRTLQDANADVIDLAADSEPGSDTFYLMQPWGAYGAA
jgi:hypothetical protein